MAKQVAIKPEEQLARQYVDRLILTQLSEMENVVKLGELAERLSGSGVGLATVRNLLASNPRAFAYAERRWVPAARVEGQGRPFAETAHLVLDRFGGPLPVSALIQEVARARNEEPEDVEPVLRRLLAGDARFLLLPTDEVTLLAWSFQGHDERPARAYALNGILADNVAALKERLGAEFDYRAEGAVERAVRHLAPVSLKGLGAAFWSVLSPEDPRAVLVFDARDFARQALGVPGYVLGPDGALHAREDAKKWIASAVRLAERLAPTIELDDAAPIEVKPEDVPALVAKVTGSDRSVPATRLLEENYEITPGTKTFPDDLANLVAALRGSEEIVWVGGDRFRRAGTLPEGIEEVPEPFQFVKTDVTDEDGEPVDVELTDEGLSTSLRKLLTHPLAMDVLDEDPSPAPRLQPESVRLVLKSIHRDLGTFPLCQFPTGWLDADPKVQELVVQDDTGRELSVWANHDARLLFGWIDWWFEQPVENGAVFTLTKTSRPNVFDFAWQEQPDPVVYISPERMEELRAIGAESEGKSTLDLLIEVFSHYPKGADYLTLLAEVNVARRSTGRLIASLLSSYQCFYQRSGSPVWHFDAKKVELGFDKTKRKFVKK